MSVLFFGSHVELPEPTGEWVQDADGWWHERWTDWIYIDHNGQEVRREPCGPVVRFENDPGPCRQMTDLEVVCRELCRSTHVPEENWPLFRNTLSAARRVAGLRLERLKATIINALARAIKLAVLDRFRPRL